MVWFAKEHIFFFVGQMECIVLRLLHYRNLNYSMLCAQPKDIFWEPNLGINGQLHSLVNIPVIQSEYKNNEMSIE